MIGTAKGIETDGQPGLDGAAPTIGSHGDHALADDLGGVGVEIHDQRRVLVDADDVPVGTQLGLEALQARGTQVAVAGVVIAALGVVVVRDHGDGQAQGCQQIEARDPFGFGADLVDLVDRHRRHAECEHRRRREHHGAAPGQLVGEDVGDGGAGPLTKGIRGASRSGEDPIGLPQPGQPGLDLDRIDADDPREAGGDHGPADALVEVLQGSLDEDVPVLLEPERGVDHHRPGWRITGGAGLQTVEDRSMRFDHGRGGLARPHEHENARCHRCPCRSIGGGHGDHGRRTSRRFGVLR